MGILLQFIEMGYRFLKYRYVCFQWHYIFRGENHTRWPSGHADTCYCDDYTDLSSHWYSVTQVWYADVCTYFLPYTLIPIGTCREDYRPVKTRVCGRLSSLIESSLYVRQFVEEKWFSDVTHLAKVVQGQPHAAYSAFYEWSGLLKDLCLSYYSRYCQTYAATWRCYSLCTYACLDRLSSS